MLPACIFRLVIISASFLSLCLRSGFERNSGQGIDSSLAKNGVVSASESTRRLSISTAVRFDGRKPLETKLSPVKSTLLLLLLLLWGWERTRSLVWIASKIDCYMSHQKPEWGQLIIGLTSNLVECLQQRWKDWSTGQQVVLHLSWCQVSILLGCRQLLWWINRLLLGRMRGGGEEMYSYVRFKLSRLIMNRKWTVTFRLVVNFFWLSPPPPPFVWRKHVSKNRANFPVVYIF